MRSEPPLARHAPSRVDRALVGVDLAFEDVLHAHHLAGGVGFVDGERDGLGAEALLAVDLGRAAVAHGGEEVVDLEREAVLDPVREDALAPLFAERLEVLLVVLLERAGGAVPDDHLRGDARAVEGIVLLDDRALGAVVDDVGELLAGELGADRPRTGGAALEVDGGHEGVLGLDAHEVVALPGVALVRLPDAAVAGLDVAVEVADGVAEVGPAVHHGAAAAHGDVVAPDPLRVLRRAAAGTARTAGGAVRRAGAARLDALGVEGDGLTEGAPLVEEPAGGAGAGHAPDVLRGGEQLAGALGGGDELLGGLGADADGFLDLHRDTGLEALNPHRVVEEVGGADVGGIQRLVLEELGDVGVDLGRDGLKAQGGPGGGFGSLPVSVDDGDEIEEVRLLLFDGGVAREVAALAMPPQPMRASLRGMVWWRALTSTGVLSASAPIAPVPV